MNVLKSIFISCFVCWLLAASIYGAVQLASGAEPLLSWLGLTLAAAAPLAFFVRSFLLKTPRTPRHPVGYSVLSGAGLAIAMTASYRYGLVAGHTHLWAGLTVLGWLAYLRWYSVVRGRPSSRLGVGAALPAFELRDLAGNRVCSESFQTAPHLLVFYRGNWCPFCCAQIQELAGACQRLAERGVRLVLISPQPAGKSAAMAARFDAPMTFLTDPEGRAARKLGIDHPWGTPLGIQLLGYHSHTVLPTVIATDTDGTVIYLDQTDNYRIRPEPAAFESAFEKSSELHGRTRTRR